MNVDLPSIQAGADTYNNMNYDNTVQSFGESPGYHAKVMLERFRHVEEAGGQQVLLWAQPGKFPWKREVRPTDRQHFVGPMFNPLHPTTQEKVLEYVGEVADRYGRWPAFRGISLNLYVGSVLWFGSLYSGYDDYTIKLFQEETGLVVPGKVPDPQRFAKRYEFLAFAARPLWVEWRCRKIRDWVHRIRDRIAKSRPDLGLTISVWQEPFLPALLGAWSTMQGFSFPVLQPYGRPTLKNILAEGGMDLDLLGREPGVELDLQIGEGRDRVTWGTEGGKGSTGVPLEMKCLFRDANYLDQETLDAFAAVKKGGAFVFNVYMEDWPKTMAFRPDPNDSSLARARDMDGKPADGIARMNCLYPEDGWWFGSQWRIYASMPTGEHYLESFAHAVAELDALRFTQGGLFMDKCHTDQLRRFALAFRALPKQKFQTVGGRTDPVAVRTLEADGRRYFYLVNREYYPVRVKLTFSQPPAALVDLATSEKQGVSSTVWETTLGAYELRSMSMHPHANVAGFDVVIPETVKKQILADADQALKELEAIKAKGRWIAGMDRMSENLRQAISEERMAWLRRAVSGYIVRRARQELGTVKTANQTR
jgi:hypothetical protein